MARSALLNIMVLAAQKAGRSLTRDFGEVENLQASRKSPGDFVTKADQNAEKTIYEELIKARPTYSFLMEERGEVQGSDGQHRWIVDPLNGTINFLHSIPLFATSIALERNGEIVAAVIYNPIMEELFTAERGGGAWTNNKRLRVSGRRNIADSIVATGNKVTGTSADVLALKQMGQISPACAGIRNTGSPATSLAWLAAGRFDGYWEGSLAPWDIAAGMLMVREAGGFITDFKGKTGTVGCSECIAGNELVHNALLKTIKSVS